MIKYLRRWWKYTTARLSGRFEERADPKVQLQQAITEVNEQHKRLKQQAANVIANRNKTELQLNRVLEDLEKVDAPIRGAILNSLSAAAGGYGYFDSYRYRNYRYGSEEETREPAESAS